MTLSLYWLYVGTNLLVLLVGGALTYLSYVAYQRTTDESLGLATVGFGVVTLGALLEMAYDFLVTRGRELTTSDLFVLRTVESLVIGLGLLVLFYALSGPTRS
ncbi:MAG: hypothetical protein ABEI77_03775 [Halorientalis sp.]